MKKKKYLILAILTTIVSVIYTMIVKYIDVKAIGPKGSKVGLASLNASFKNIVGSHMKIYKITEVLGLVTLLIVGIYGIIGLIQLIKRKSIKKVDKEIITLGILYVMMGLVYVFFEKCVVNYRPILLDGVLEASYPSSHTILSICICISSIIVSKKYLKNTTVTNILTTMLLFGVLFGRLFSGAHWLSDIIGGFLISLTLISYFNLIYNYKK